MLREEEKIVDKNKLLKVLKRWQNRRIGVEVKNIEIFKHKHREEKKNLIAVSLHSKAVLKIREELGFDKKPKKMTLHCTLLELLLN